MPEARRKPQQSGANYRATWSFGQLLEWHLDNGTRPGADCGVRWLRTKFAYEVGLTSDRALRFWLRDENLPDGLHLALIEQALFGRDTAAHPDLREELRRAHRRAKSVGQPARGVGGAAPLLPPDRRIGRDEQVAQLVSALTCNDPAACLVLGAPGIGKTTLTLRVATSGALIERFGARRWFVPLETASDAATLRTALTAAACLDLAHARFEDALLRLGEQPCLVILDNLETPWETEPQLVEGILRQVAAVPGVALLASMRGEAMPLAPRWTSRLQVVPLKTEAARELFHEIAPNIAPNDPQLGDFLSALGGIPLAVELVACRAATHDSLAELWREWKRLGVPLLTRPGIDPARLTSLVHSIELSLHSRRLGEHGKRLFRLLGQLPAGLGGRLRRLTWRFGNGRRRRIARYWPRIRT